MKRIFSLLLVCLVATAAAFAQADKIVGVYKTTHEGVNSKIQITKVNDGYRAQVIWVDKLTNPDGTVRTDKKNPDKNLRDTPVNQIVLIDKMKYDAKDNEWGKGKIYEPSSGKKWTVTCTFESDTKLRVRGSWGIFGKSVYWTKVE
ncbi:MAG: DUF2147 domain-containing protein [Bacteroidaceae bacterium]|mgnify:FL=1|nr:DUF2147 domain-containing protein [Bacteroidaceae bacterium]